MHARQEFMDMIMYGNGEHPNCNCKSINYSNYYKKDIEKTKEAYNTMKDLRKASNIYVVIDGKAYSPVSVETRLGYREGMEFAFTVSTEPRYALENTTLAIKNVIFNPPATIVFWGDGSKTVVKCQDGEVFDPEKGLTMAFFKKMHGNTGHYFEEIKKWTEEYFDKESEETRTFIEMIANNIFREFGLTPNLTDNYKKEPEKSVGWALFYAKADRGEDEGYTRHPVIYKHKSSAVRAAKRLISKLPAGVEYTWYVDSIEQ